MSQQLVLLQALSLVLEGLRKELVPVVLQQADELQLAYPGDSTEGRLFLTCYDVADTRPFGVPRPIPQGPTLQQAPNRYLALRFLLYANRKRPFGGLEAVDELVLLEGAVRAAHSMGPLELEGEPLRLQLESPPTSEKTALWQSMGQPIQPALYLMLEAIPVPSSRVTRIAPVKELYLHLKGKGGTSP